MMEHVQRLKEYLSELLYYEELLLGLRNFIRQRWDFVDSESLCNEISNSLRQSKEEKMAFDAKEEKRIADNMLRQDKINHFASANDLIMDTIEQLRLKRDKLLDFIHAKNAEISRIENNDMTGKRNEFARDGFIMRGFERSAQYTSLDAYGKMMAMPTLRNSPYINDYKRIYTIWLEKDNLSNEVKELKCNLSMLEEKLRRHNADICKLERECQPKSGNTQEFIDKIRDLEQWETIAHYFRNNEAILLKLYSLNILHPDYYNLIAVSFIYDYIEKGMTYSLSRDGADPGAYFLYKEDARVMNIMSALEKGFDRVTSGLHTITSQISVVQENQKKLYATIQESNKILYTILEGLRYTGTVLSGISSKLESANRSFAGMLNRANGVDFILQGLSAQINTTHRMLSGIPNNLHRIDRTLSEIPTFWAQRTGDSSVNKEMARNLETLLNIERDRWEPLRSQQGFPRR